MANRVCRDCPTIIPSTAYKGRCATCSRQADRARGTHTERGYGSTVLDTPLGRMTYNQARRRYQRRMDDGERFECADNCGRIVDPNAWHLGHDNFDRSRLVGPLTSTCNLSAAGRSSHM